MNQPLEIINGHKLHKWESLQYNLNQRIDFNEIGRTWFGMLQTSEAPKGTQPAKECQPRTANIVFKNF
jgi:hypothetical protein